MTLDAVLINRRAEAQRSVRLHVGLSGLGIILSLHLGTLLPRFL